MKRWLFLLRGLVACGSTYQPLEGDYVEVASSRPHDAGPEARDAQQDRPLDSTLPWWDPQEVGNPPPHHAR